MDQDENEDEDEDEDGKSKRRKAENRVSYEVSYGSCLIMGSLQIRDQPNNK